MTRKPTKAATRKTTKKTTTRSALRAVHPPASTDVLDACDLKLADAEATPDEDLPVAEGGVA